ncbi:MAG: cofactor-independent phosphoglycerate mutase, partial [Methermicoccaceae archaeon]
MKYVVLVGDGMGDYPIEGVGKTVIEEAHTPNMDYIARRGVCGLAKTLPEGMPKGSDVANMSILGYNPEKYYTARGPIEAEGMGIALDRKDVVFRCNLITVLDGKIADYSAGHIDTESAEKIISEVNAQLGDESTRFHAGLSYRHIMVTDAGEKATSTPPHDAIGVPIKKVMPKGKGSRRLCQLIRASEDVIAECNRELHTEATHIWLWSGGRRLMVPSYAEKFGLSGSVVSAVDLLKGLARCAVLDVIEVEGATGHLDTNYRGKAKAALSTLDEKDFVLVHVEAPDEAGHMRDLEAKLEAIEQFDEKVVGTVLDELPENTQVLITPDHYTPFSLGVHTGEPVPFAALKEGEEGDEVNAYSEKDCAKGVLGTIMGYEMMDVLIR